MNVHEGPHLVAAGLLRRGGRGLLVHRSPTRRWYPDCWDLPGGHVEDGESGQMALRRELHEELGVTVDVPDAAFAQVQGSDFRMDIWAIDEWEGEPINMDLTEHDALAWLRHDEMAGLVLADPRLTALFREALH